MKVSQLLRRVAGEFSRAKLHYGHGTHNAKEEAAWLISSVLGFLLEQNLNTKQISAINAIARRRIRERKPLAYLLHEAWLGEHAFYVDERVIVPRSYIGELLFSGLFGGDGHNLIKHPEKTGSVLDLCTGSGCLAILAAGIFPNAGIDAVDLSADALAVARINVKEHDLEQRVTLHQGDLFAPLSKKKYDLIITNPPYVAAAEVAAFPKEYAHEPAMAHLGGPDGLDITRRILAEAPKHLNKGGGLLCEIGTGRGILEREFPKLKFFWLDTEESAGEVFWLKF